MTTRTLALALPLAATLLLAGCGNTPSDQSASDAAASATPTPSTAPASPATTSTPASPVATTDGHMGHEMDGGPAPANMKPATDPKYAPGSEVILQADHMHGMQGAKAKVVGVYSTVTYAVTYTPATGGPQVTNHKWVVQEELKDAGTARLADGAPVTIEADHMPGMKGAKGTVVSSTTEPVHIVDYTAHGMEMTNHKWVVESEISPAK